MKINKKSIILVGMLFAFMSIHTQSFLKKKEQKAYECGYVYKPSFFSKLKPMKIISKLAGGLVTGKAKSDLGKTAIAISYGTGSIPLSQLDFTTKLDGWETCGSAVSVSFLDFDGVGLTNTDGEVKVNNVVLKGIGLGSYFQGFPASENKTQNFEITSSNGDKVNVSLEPSVPLEIISVNGVPKGGDIIIDGTKDVTIELKGVEDDLDSEIFVELVVSAMSMKVQTYLFKAPTKNTIVVPKEAFKNYEQSLLPIIKKNTLIVGRVKHKLIRNTDAGIIQTVRSYADFTPVLMDGDIAGGSLLGKALSKDKNVKVKGEFETVEGEYEVNINKGNAYISPPVARMKKIGIMSLAVRGNLYVENTSTKTTTNSLANTTTTTTTTVKKWFPELTDETWQKFANKLYDELALTLKTKHGVETIDVKKVINTKAYNDFYPVSDTVTKSFVEKSAYGTKRLLTTNTIDYLSDLKMTFPNDFSNEKIMQELELDGLIAVTVDLNFNYSSEGLDPVVKITAFAPNVTYRTPGQYFEMDFTTKTKSVSSAGKYPNGKPEIGVYNLIKGDDFFKAFSLAIKQIEKGESENPAYERIWENRMK